MYGRKKSLYANTIVEQQAIMLHSAVLSTTFYFWKLCKIKHIKLGSEKKKQITNDKREMRKD